MNENRKTDGRIHNARPTFYGDPMTLQHLYMPDSMWKTLGEKSAALSKEAGKRITRSDLVRTAVEKLLKAI